MTTGQPDVGRLLPNQFEYNIRRGAGGIEAATREKETSTERQWLSAA